VFKAGRTITIISSIAASKNNNLTRAILRSLQTTLTAPSCTQISFQVCHKGNELHLRSAHHSLMTQSNTGDTQRNN
jgi:hypothetical protein